MDAGCSVELLKMLAIDAQTRERLASDGSLFSGYHPEMRAVHEDNAGRLDAMIRAWGWPSIPKVGKEASRAAWMIAQHAISCPVFQRKCLAELQEAALAGEVDPWQPAYLEDRIRIFEGRGQIFGTQFDWDSHGLMSPQPIEDEAHVDERRKSVGLPPIADALAAHRVRSADEPEPTDLATRSRDAEEFARSVGWR